MSKPAYKRILLKLSGEALMGDDAYGINRTTITRIVKEIKEVVELGVQVAVADGVAIAGDLSVPGRGDLGANRHGEGLRPSGGEGE